MAVRLRLSKTGGKNDVSFRLVAVDSRAPRDGRYIENLGWYDPKKSGANFELKMERIAYWEGKGALPSYTANSLIRRARRAAKV
jgi:small subunit ribosomal protein S16